MNRKTGKPAGFIWVLRDVTEEKHEEKHKNNFLSLITHKLKTPLTTIIGYSPVLLERIKDPDERIVTALNSIKRQGELLNDAGNLDQIAQPHDQGLGKLPSTCRRKNDVLEGGSPHLAGALALGAAQTSKQVEWLGSAEIFPHHRP